MESRDINISFESSAAPELVMTLDPSETHSRLENVLVETGMRILSRYCVHTDRQLIIHGKLVEAKNGEPISARRAQQLLERLTPSRHRLDESAVFFLKPGGADPIRLENQARVSA